MSLCVDLLELADAHFGVEPGGLQGAVSQEFLDKADVCSLFQHQGGEGVAEKAKGALLICICEVDVLAHNVAEMGASEGVSLLCEEESLWAAFIG